MKLLNKTLNIHFGMQIDCKYILINVIKINIVACICNWFIFAFQ